ncbi:MAG: hypothetical protein ACKORG_06600 [Actinomycetota bacterium]
MSRRVAGGVATPFRTAETRITHLPDRTARPFTRPLMNTRF